MMLFCRRFTMKRLSKHGLLQNNLVEFAKQSRRDCIVISTKLYYNLVEIVRPFGNKRRTGNDRTARKMAGVVLPLSAFGHLFFHVLLHLLHESGVVRTVHKLVADGEREGEDAAVAAEDSLADVHQREVLPASDGNLRIGDGGEEELRRGAEAQNVEVAFLQQLLVQLVWVAVVRYMVDDVACLLVERGVILDIRDAHAVESASGHGDGRDAVDAVVEAYIAVFVLAVAVFLHLVGSPQHGIQVAGEERRAIFLCLVERPRAVNLCRHVNPSVERAFEKEVVVASLPCVNVNDVLHNDGVFEVQTYDFCAEKANYSAANHARQGARFRFQR